MNERNREVESVESRIDDEQDVRIDVHGTVSGDTQKYFIGFEQDDPFVYWS